MRYSRLIFLVLFGFLTGISIAVYRVTHWTGADATITNGAWMGNNLDNVGKSHLLTARIAVAALFALRPDETLYLVAKNDDQGRPLSPKHDYIIKGSALSARYWSITLYESDYFLVENESKRYGFNMNSLQYESDGTFTIHVSQKRKEGNWLPSGGDGKFYLALRLYHPEKQLHENISTARLPSIHRAQ